MKMNWRVMELGDKAYKKSDWLGWMKLDDSKEVNR